MPTNRTKRSRARQTLDYWKIDQLVTGDFLIANVGYAAAYPNGCNSWTAEQWEQLNDTIRDEWRQIGAEFMAWWRGDTERFTAVYSSIGGKRRDPDIEPWALREFGEPGQ